MVARTSSRAGAGGCAGADARLSGRCGSLEKSLVLKQPPAARAFGFLDGLTWLP
jgi:hypothetical protein